MQVRKKRNDTFGFVHTLKDCSRIVRRVRLSRDVGDVFYLLTGFSLNGSNRHSIAIIDVSEHLYMWHVIEDPLSRDVRVRRSFSLGFHGERIEWAFNKNNDVEFVSLRQTIDTKRTRALLRNASAASTNLGIGGGAGPTTRKAYVTMHADDSHGARCFQLRLTGPPRCRSGRVFTTERRQEEHRGTAEKLIRDNSASSLCVLLVPSVVKSDLLH